jgi:hypothetical protein
MGEHEAWDEEVSAVMPTCDTLLLGWLVQQ